MPNQKRPEPSMADTVYDRLLADIVSGRYELQSRLPPEEELAKECGVSRPVLRTALARLREDGMVASRRGSGNFIVRRPDDSVMDFVPLGSIADIQRCYEFRSDVESSAAALAAKRRDQEDLDALERAHDQFDRAYSRSSLGVEADQAFHAAIARATKNPFYVSVLDSLSRQITFGMELSRSLTLQSVPERQALVQDEHQRIIDAIRSRNPEASAAAMRDHLAGARDRMFVGKG